MYIVSVTFALANFESSPFSSLSPLLNVVEHSSELDEESQNNTQTKCPTKSPTKCTWDTIRPRAHALLSEILTEMELSMPGPNPFKHRTPVNRRSQGAGCQELTAIVDDELVTMWETTMLAKDQQTLWSLVCRGESGHGHWQWRESQGEWETPPTPSPVKC